MAARWLMRTAVPTTGAGLVDGDDFVVGVVVVTAGAAQRPGPSLSNLIHAIANKITLVTTYCLHQSWKNLELQWINIDTTFPV